MKRDKLFFAICCMAMANMTTLASAQTDSTSVGNKVFDANDYLMQKRYIPTGRTINKNAKGRNLSIGAFGGISKQQGEGSRTPMIKEFGLSLTKDVNSFNSYRISVTGGLNDVFKRVGFEADHIFRIQDYLMGWNKDRKFSIETVWGLGVYGTMPDKGDNKVAGGLHGGLIFTKMMSKHFDIFLEPRVNLFSDGIDAHTSARRYDLSGQVLAGIKYRFTGNNTLSNANKDCLDNIFYELYVGTNGDFSDRTWSYHKMKTLGPAAGLSIGKWFYPLGVRATGFGGVRSVPNGLRNDSSEEPYAGLRLEGMINLNTLFIPYSHDPKFEVNVSAGYEFGALAHKSSGVYKTKIKSFNGPTAALQGVYFVRPDLGLFAQARWSQNEYTQDFIKGPEENRVMKNVGLEVGVQYRRRYEKVQERKSKYLFQPYNFVSAQIGTNFPLHTAGVTKDVLKDELGQQFSLSYGRRYSRSAAVRGTIEVAKYGYSKNHDTYPLTIAADIMVDALSFVGGYNPDRIVNVYPFAGILYTHNETADKNNFGIQGGADVTFRISDHWNIYLEGALRMYKGQITPSARLYTGADFSFVPNVSAGVAYRF